MILMMILMFLPLIAIPVFWLLPIDLAIPVYLACVLLSAWMFWIMRRTHKRPVVTGAEGLIKQEARVVSKAGAAVFVRVEGELWAARSDDPLDTGDRVIIVGKEGNMLRIKRTKLETGSQ